MKLKRRLLCLMAGIISLVLLSVPALALEAFEITSFDILMDVDSDNSYKITETIDVKFLDQRHGIIRSIPLKTYRGALASVTGVKTSDHKFITEKASGNLEIKIGDADKFAKNNEQYIITYVYNLGDDGLSDMDELYFNLIGTDWDCPISNITFTIKMPSRFEDTKLYFTYGKSGSVQNDAVSWGVNGKTITGQLNGSLKPHEALTVALPLPQGYFADAKPADAGLINQYGWVLSILITACGVGLWIALGKKKQSFPTVEFYPPQGTTSADVGFLIDGRVDPFDITSLIIYWADKGYLSITEQSVKKLLGAQKSFLLTKLREMGEETKPYERKMFSDLFKYGNGMQVDTMQLTNRFYMTTDQVKRFIKSGFEDQSDTRIFNRSNSTGKLFLWVAMILALLPTMVVSYKGVIDEGSGKTFLMGLVMSVFLMIALYALMHNLTNWSGLPKKGRFGQLFISLLFSAFLAGLSLYLAIESNLMLQMVISIVCAVVLAFLACRCRRRTALGVWYEERLIGFKEFLKATELDRIKLLVNENPQYFYNVLPYAMVLGVTDKWAKNFERITISPPNWYYSATPYGVFYASHFVHDLEQGMRGVSANMASRPSSESGGSSSGGSAGSGSGGGGGSSW